MLNTAKENNLGTEKIGKLLWKFSIPAIIGQIVNMLYTVVDRIYIGHIADAGGLAITGVGLVSPLTQIITGLGMLVGVGASVQISLSLGKGDKERARQYLSGGIIGIWVISILITVLGSIFADPILRLFGGTDATVGYGLAYLRPLLWGTIFNLTAFGLNGCISSDGNPKIGMLTMIIGASINIVVDPILIFGFDLGIAGAAYATVISQLCAAFWLLHYFFRSKKAQLHIDFRTLRLHKNVLMPLVAIGVAPCLMQIANSFVQVFSNNLLLTHGGDLAIGAMTVMISICSIFIMPIFGLTHGCQPIMGFNFGAGQYARVREAWKLVATYATLILVVGYLGIMLIPQVMVSFFNSDPALTEIAVHGMRIYLFFFPLVGLQLTATSFYQACGNPKKATLIGLTRQVLFLIPLFMVLPSFLGLDGIWISGAIADLLSISLSMIIIRRDFKKMRLSEGVCN
ncbi:MAG: MATE family efflux transporter [Angelakisella sp.]